MFSLGAMTVVGLAVLVALIVLFLRIRMQDLVEEHVKRRSAGSRVCTRADFVEGRERIPVALQPTDDTIYYENPDLQASLEPDRIDEVDNEDATAKGQSAIRQRFR